ncbi:hypothetical protein Bra3105_04725 [Brachybacterium halotolerans subsp. kimchii]|uniref:hypothetical protein n=1 Tax=Brachybacterium halotolerans TaxID=2795215 RepID=UPI001E5953FD|nr:hypothetical protein [Brachybacterium halotolerans]UEJ83620.1 hypothetical protein Bra3105_04725 [Brachybacterium halotolerans subsp. kimchii]
MARSRRSRSGRSRMRHLTVPLVMLLVLVFVVAGTFFALTRFASVQRSGQCTAAGLGTTHEYTTERTANAALISAVAVDRGLPPRAASIALATAYQESKLQNIEHGDRDSQGLFQQRPSQGWGTQAQIMDPVHATNAFYDSLVKLDYASMSVNDAAQKVQRSGYPEAYGDHETEGRIFASALTGQSGANLVCDIATPDSAASPQSVQDALKDQFPRRTKAGAITSSLASASSVATSRPDGSSATALVIDTHGDTALGWAVANWSVARAADDGVVQVSYLGRAWQRESHDQEAGTWPSVDGGDADRVVVLVAGG